MDEELSIVEIGDTFTLETADGLQISVKQILNRSRLAGGANMTCLTAASFSGARTI